MKSKVVKITHSCGHEKAHTIVYFNAEDRDDKIDFLEHSECSECDHKEENEEAAKNAEEKGLPKLKGSEKQVAWATSIREEIYKKLKETLKPEMWDKSKTLLFSKTDASFYIDNRNSTVREYINEYTEDLKKAGII